MNRCVVDQSTFWRRTLKPTFQYTLNTIVDPPCSLLYFGVSLSRYIHQYCLGLQSECCMERSRHCPKHRPACGSAYGQTKCCDLTTKNNEFVTVFTYASLTAIDIRKVDLCIKMCKLYNFSRTEVRYWQGFIRLPTHVTPPPVLKISTPGFLH